jgi:3,4-dihydroxy 2-butanone 4-phosphate synthase/GTP cyclohydrolase II
MSISCSVEEAISEIRKGNIVIVVDDESRENEGDMIVAAEKITADKVNFMIKHARGLVCLGLTPERSRELDLKPMVADNTAKLGTAFTVSIDAIQGTTTGISAFDRTETIRAAIAAHSRAGDFARPGHVFPLTAYPGGVLRRAGHTEAAVDLATLAGLYPAGVLCEVIDEDGHMARLPRLAQFAVEHGLKIVTIQDLIEYRRRTERLVSQTARTLLPTRYGTFTLYLYRSETDDAQHVALVKGDIGGDDPTLVRVHSECLTGDVFGSNRCDCGSQLGTALMQIEAAGRGVLLYMRQEGRGIGLENKIKAYALQEHGIKRMRLLTNNPKKVVGLKAYGIEIVERVPVEVPANENNIDYLSTKRDKLGHILVGLEERVARLNGTDRKE